MGRGAFGRPAGRPRGSRGSGGAAAPAAHPDGAGEEDGRGDGQGRPGAKGRNGEVPARQARGVQGIAPRPEVIADARLGVEVESLAVSAYTIPTDEPESDGTLEWDSTTIVVVEAHGRGETGLGYTYGPKAVGAVVDELLAEVVRGADAGAPGVVWGELGARLRNAGRPGMGFMAVAAVDTALWDLKARLLDLPLVDLLPRAHDEVPIYGSGGFCSYSLERPREQLGDWREQGIPRVKMKLGRPPHEGPA